MKLEIKKEYLDTVVGFNGSAKPLGKRSDIHLLAQMAIKTKSVSLLKFFKEIPSEKDLNDLKAKDFLKNNPLPKKPQTKSRKPSQKNPRPKQSKKIENVEPKENQKLKSGE